MNSLKNTTILTLLLCFGNLLSYAQYKTTIPLNSNIIHNTLPNGMNYYILHNNETKKKVNFYLVQNVGSILEDDQQIGFAQIIERMAYKSLKHFPNSDWLNHFEANGIHLGSDIKSYTSQDETIYNFKNIHSKNNNELDSALMVIYDWSCGGLLWKDKDLNDVKNQIQQEWAKENTPEFRMMKEVMSGNYNHSIYARRNIMQNIDSIPEIRKNDIISFYQKWYHPNLQSLVIIGDIDPKLMEEKVRKLFSNLPISEKQADRQYFPIKDSKEISYTITRNKESQNSNISWIFREDPITVKDESYIRKQLTLAMMKSIFNDRLKKVTQTQDCDALDMNIGFFELGRIKNAAFLSVTPKDNKIKEAFILLNTELERAFKYGFTESELKNTQNAYLERYESYLDQIDKISNDTWAAEIEDYILKAEPLPDITWEVNFAKTTIPNITLKDINQLLETFKHTDNSSLSLTGPENDSILYPSKEEILSTIQNVQQSKIEPWKDSTDEEKLIKDDLYMAKVVEKTELPESKAQVYLLENGAKVVFLPTDNNKNEILFQAYSFGGVSVVSQEDLASANLSTMLAIISGAGDFDGIELQKKLGDNTAYVSPFIQTYTEGFTGSASTRDFETLLKLIYLKFTHPRFDSTIYENIVSNLQNRLAPSLKDNSKAFTDSISMLTNNYSPRNLIFNQDFINNLDFEKTKKVYLDRFKDAGDFTFVFVGNIDTERDLSLAQKYIGSLPAVHRSEKWVNTNMKPAKGYTHKTFIKNMDTSQSSVYYALYKNTSYNLYNRTMLEIIADLLRKRYNELLLNVADSSYKLSVTQKSEKIPYEHSSLAITFHCNPQQQDTITKIIKSEMQKLQVDGPSPNYLESLKENYIKNRIEYEKKNSFWLTEINNSLMYNENFMNNKSYTDMINNINVNDVRKFAKKLFRNNDSVEVDMKPAQ